MNLLNPKPLRKPVLFTLTVSVWFLSFSPGHSHRQPVKKDAQYEKCLVPVLVSDYILIYEPKGDVFPGPDTKDLEAGTYYALWQPNDHCFVKGPDKHGRAFYIYLKSTRELIRN